MPNATRPKLETWTTTPEMAFGRDDGGGLSATRLSQSNERGRGSINPTRMSSDYGLVAELSASSFRLSPRRSSCHPVLSHALSAEPGGPVEQLTVEPACFLYL